MLCHFSVLCFVSQIFGGNGLLNVLLNLFECSLVRLFELNVINFVVNNAPTLSKLLEMPVRDRGQPLPTISSLMEPDAAKDNGTESKFADGFGANSLSYLRDLSSPIKSLLMGELRIYVKNVR